MPNSILTIAKIAATAGMIFPLAVLLYRYFVCECPERKQRKAVSTSGMVVTVFVSFAVSRLFYYLVALAGAAINGKAAAFFSGGMQSWIRWDAYHYIGLIKNWYVNEGDPRFHIVFYPLYPLLGRIVNAFLNEPSLSAFLTSNAALLAAGCAFFRLSEERGYDPVFCTWVLMLLPTGFYFSVPYTEAVFLMCCVYCALAAARRKFAAAITFGALAAFSRSLGAVCAVVVFYEMLCVCRERAKDAANPRKTLIWGAVRAFFTTCLILTGVLAYLLINYRVTGDPFRFLTYQKEHWGQEFGSLWNTVGYTLENAVTFYDQGYRTGVWIPQIISIFLVIALLCASCFRIHPADGAFALVYTYCAVAPTWLLSGPRYLFAMYPVVYLGAIHAKGKAGKIVLLLVELLAAVYCVYMFAVQGSLL